MRRTAYQQQLLRDPSSDCLSVRALPTIPCRCRACVNAAAYATRRDAIHHSQHPHWSIVNLWSGRAAVPVAECCAVCNYHHTQLISCNTVPDLCCLVCTQSGKHLPGKLRSMPAYGQLNLLTLQYAHQAIVITCIWKLHPSCAQFCTCPGNCCLHKCTDALLSLDFKHDCVYVLIGHCLCDGNGLYSSLHPSH